MRDKNETHAEESPKEPPQSRIEKFFMWLWYSPVELNTEESTRIKDFHSTLQNINWLDIDDNQRVVNLNMVFNALHKLASNDLEYYNKHREKSKNLRRWTINLSIILGALGGIVIALQSVKKVYGFLGVEPTDMVAIGAAIFIVAGAFFTWHKAFCANESHIRHVVAQFDLGERIEKFEMEWQEWLSTYSNAHYMTGNADYTTGATKAFVLFNDFAQFIYKTIREDTKKWSSDIREALKEAEDKIKQQSSSNR